MRVIFWSLAILIIFLCGIGIIVCMGIAAERIDALMREEYGKDEDGQQDI